MFALEIAAGIILLGGVGLATVSTWPEILSAGIVLVVVGATWAFAPAIVAVLASTSIPCGIWAWLEVRRVNRMAANSTKARNADAGAFLWDAKPLH